VHGHASVGSRKVTIPGYIVKRGEEEQIQYHATSPLANELHPMRPKPDELKAKIEAETVEEEKEAKEKAQEEQKIKVAKPKLKKIITTELKEEKEEKESPPEEPEKEE
jgi:ribosomal protein S4